MIIVFGSMNMDLVFTPEHAPGAGETVLLDGYKALPGGKGANQAVAAARMGSETAFVGCAGQDGFAGDLMKVMTDHGVSVDGVNRADLPTGTAVVVVERSGENRILVASGANRAARQAQVSDDMLDRASTVLMQMEVSLAENLELARRAQGRVDRVMLNLAPAMPIDPVMLDHLDFLILNEIEICQLAGHLGLDHLSQDFEAAAHKLAVDHQMTCVVTLGEKGAVAYGPDGHIHRVAAIALDRVVDTTGAGDAFCGFMAAALDQGYGLEDALNIACAAGSLACLGQGAMGSYPDQPTVLKAISQEGKRALS